MFYGLLPDTTINDCLIWTEHWTTFTPSVFNKFSRVLSRHLFCGRTSPKLRKFPRTIGQVYSSIKNPVIAVIKRAAVTKV